MPTMRVITLLCLIAIVGCNDLTSHQTVTPPQSTRSEARNDKRYPLSMKDSDHPWRNDPALIGMFHPEYPDDLQVMVHEGGPRLTKARPELIWVHVTGKHAGAYEGILLNQPHQLETLKLNDRILFLPANTGNKPFRVTEKYLNERKGWHLKPCDKCGMPEQFDAPSELQAKIFPDILVDANLEKFTTFCPVCGGVQVVSSKPIEGQP